MPRRFAQSRITPACAGSTCRCSMKKDSWQDHPRLRGEYVSVSCSSCFCTGSPPLARGVHIEDLQNVETKRITPACAGSTVLHLYSSPCYRDHPRLRGEYYQKNSKSYRPTGSPPLARGVHEVKQAQKSFRRITPACAGSTPEPSRFSELLWDHPRLRGEYCISHIQ